MRHVPDPADLAQIEAIKQLVAIRARAIDTGDWETYAECHAPDHVSHGASFAAPPGRAEMIAALKQAYAGITSIHCVHSPVIVLSGPGQAQGTWSMSDRLYWRERDAEHWALGWGIYAETYRRDAGEWRFTSRQLHYLRRELSPGQTRFPAQ
ncbi:MAG TPA: nuclear transport factor 2 family protein [Novosphingobium sp.]